MHSLVKVAVGEEAHDERDEPDWDTLGGDVERVLGELRDRTMHAVDIRLANV